MSFRNGPCDQGPDRGPVGCGGPVGDVRPPYEGPVGGCGKGRRDNNCCELIIGIVIGLVLGNCDHGHRRGPGHDC